MQHITDAIRDIQNTLWAIYKDFLSDHDVKAYTRKANELVCKYEGDKIISSYVQNLAISWSPMINELARWFREDKNG